MTHILKSTQLKKQTFLANMRVTLGNITESCKEAGISRQTYYNWRDSDPDFVKAVDDINEESIDFAESALKQRIREGDTTAIIFYLKTKGKSRGYVERQEIAAGISTPKGITVLPADKEQEDLLLKLSQSTDANRDKT